MELIWFAILHDWAVLLPIIVCSIVTVAVALERWWFYRRNKRDVVQFIHRLERELQRSLDNAQILSTNLGGILGEVAEEGVRIVRERKAHFEQSFDIASGLAARKLEEHLPILGTIATISPYLGLFGTVVSIVAGLAADEKKRGRIFGLLGLTGPLGTLLGGLIFGPIVDRWGYTAAYLFIFLLELALPLASLPVTGIFIPKRTSSQARHASPNLSSGFFLLIGAIVFACSGGFIGTIGISLTMHDLGFPASSLSLVAAIGGLIALPLPYLIGRLSDRVGRRMLLSTSYLTGMFGLLTLTFANVFGLFALASGFNNIRAFVSSGLAQALVTDLVPKESLSRAMSLYQSFVWVGGIIGFALSGVLFHAIGQRATFIAAAAIILIAIGLVSLIHLRSPHVAPA